MSIQVHRADTRGYADHGWLQTHHTFSFANYHDPERMGCGALRVLNDDMIAAGKAFGWHGHSDMEIFTIPLSGSLRHEDSLGHVEILKPNDIQVMSAGKGVMHSEANASASESLSLLQIWIEPAAYQVDPRHDTFTFNLQDRRDHIQLCIGPKQGEGVLWLYQDAYVSWLDVEEQLEHVYRLHNPQNGVYLFVIEGDAEVKKEKLTRRDGAWIIGEAEFSINASPKSRLLFIEVPQT